MGLALAGAPIVYAAPAQAQYVLNLRDADIRAFIQDAARVTGRTIIIDPQVQGRVSVVTQRALSRSEYFELFLSTLRANGFVAVPLSNGALRVQPVAGAASSAPIGRAARRSSSTLVTEIIRVRSIEPAQAIETLRPLVSREGSITASRNSILVSDFADNVRRVRQVLGQIDQAAAPAVDRTATRVIGVENIGPRELAQALAGLAPEGVSVVPIDSANSIALRGDAATLARLAAIATELDQRAARGSDVRVVYLQHADAAQLLPVLQTLLGQQPTYAQPLENSRFANNPTTSTTGTSPAVGAQAPRPLGGNRGTTAPITASAPQGEPPPAYRNAVVTRFEGANAIIISANQDVQRMLSEVVRQLDVRREQVLVEAIIVELSDRTAQQLGVRLFLAGLNGSAIPFGITNYSNLSPNLGQIAGIIGARELAGTTVIRNPDGTTTTTTGVSQDLIQQGAAALAGITGGVAGLGFRAGDALFGAILNAVRADNASNLLSIPSTMTLDNQEARFLVGQEIPITTGEALSPNFDNAFRTVQRQNVGITLQVRPQINAGGAIKMDLRVEVSSIAGPVSSRVQDLILNKRESENTLVVDDGEIAVIGGLLDENERRTLEKVPLLGDLPLIGNLFRSRGRERNKTNLMIFIRPTIIRSTADARAIAARRYDYIRDQQQAQNPMREPTLDELVRDYMGTVPPTTPAELRPNDVVVDPTRLPGIGGVDADPAPVEVPMPSDAPARQPPR